MFVFIYIYIQTSIIFLLEGFVATDLVRAEDPHPIVTFFTPHEFAGMIYILFYFIFLSYCKFVSDVVTFKCFFT